MTLVLERRLIVVEFQLRQIGEVDREIEGEIPVGIAEKVERGPPLVEVPLEADDLGLELPVDNDQKGVGEKLVLNPRLCRSGVVVSTPGMGRVLARL